MTGLRLRLSKHTGFSFVQVDRKWAFGYTQCLAWSLRQPVALELACPRKWQPRGWVNVITLTVGQRILLALALVMLLWYVVGTWYNRRLSIRTLNWLRDGLSSLGGQLHASWIASAASGARLIVDKANPPFRRLEITFLLESRELLALWLVNLLRGKRDELDIKAVIRSPQRGVVEVVSPGSQLERSLRQDSRSSWQWEDGPHGLRVAYRGRQGEALTVAVIPFVQKYGGFLRRFSCRTDKPHLVLHARLAGLSNHSPTDFFDDLTAVFAPSLDAKQQPD